MKLWFNLLCRDIDAQFEFYRSLLDLPEAAQSRSPIYCALETADFQFGFNAAPAYALLGIGERQPAHDARLPVVAYATFMVDTPAGVDAAAAYVARSPGDVIKPPFATYYGQWQAVLQDPEGNVFRVACAALPAGVAPGSLSLPQ
ncbi:VOC family protein [Cupriavidus pauculus]|jgi:predicted enzyme related to lactoylglutathione lyase|uniref:VOC family protein n=1 Tax=Cupriavidus pauculus TaxID=82633 RepID=UPI00385760A9